MNTSINKHAIEVQLVSGSTDLYIFFGGISQGITMPIFEFYQSAQILDTNKIFIRSMAQCWYQSGVSDLSNNIDASANVIQQEIERIAPKNIYFVGNSMGGFAAILFSTLIGCGKVVAFAPQTFISPHLRLWHRDNRWAKQIRNAYKKRLSRQGIWDLKPLLQRSIFKPEINIYVAPGHRLDYIHAQHIKNIPNVTIHEIEGAGHGVVKTLRDRGMLPTILSTH